MPAIGLDHVQLAMPAGEEARARHFYGTLLGLTELLKPAPLAARGGVWFQCGGSQVHLGVEQDIRPAKKAHPGFLIHAFDALLTQLRAEGFETTDDLSLPGVRRAFTADPFGNRIELIDAEAVD